MTSQKGCARFTPRPQSTLRLLLLFLASSFILHTNCPVLAETGIGPTATAATVTSPTDAAFNNAAVSGHASAALLQPLWGCEPRSLISGGIHIVVATFDADPSQLLPWLWHLGLTNAHIYVYYRVDDPSIRAMYDVVQLPCNMTLFVRPLLPNKGREAAAFLHHIVGHYDRLPMALMLAHDHGPASRHSMCGPFYRRARAYYRGLVERQEWAELAVAGEKLEEARAGTGLSKQGIFVRFTSMVVTLASGCVETWARGCCALFICSSSVQACPFRDMNCTALERNMRSPGGVRRVFLHTNGRYDARYENQVLDPYDGSSRPMSMMRYITAEHRTGDMWNISHEYPPDITRVDKNRTMEILKDLLHRYGFMEKRRSTFKSCCASLILRMEHIRRWPLELYKDLLSYSMDPRMDYEATKAVSGPGWALWLDRDYTPNDVLNYIRIDTKFQHIQGCPAQFSPHLQPLLDRMRSRRHQVQAQRHQ